MLTDRDLEELRNERHADYVAETAAERRPAPKAEAMRKKTALEAARRLEAACNAMRAYMRACNECNDASASFESQGKGIDGRTKLIADMAEFSSYIGGLYSPAA